MLIIQLWNSISNISKINNNYLHYTKKVIKIYFFCYNRTMKLEFAPHDTKDVGAMREHDLRQRIIKVGIQQIIKKNN